MKECSSTVYVYFVHIFLPRNKNTATQTETVSFRDIPLWEDTEIWQTLKKQGTMKQRDIYTRALMCSIYGGDKPVDYWHTLSSVPRKMNATEVQWDFGRHGDLVQDFTYEGPVKHSWIEFGGRKGPVVDGLLKIKDVLPLIAMQTTAVSLHAELDRRPFRFGDGDVTVIEPLMDFGDVEMSEPLRVRYTLLPPEMRRQVAQSRPKEWQGLRVN